MKSVNATKRKMFIIATCIFMVTMSTVLFLVHEDKLDINHDDIKAFVLETKDIEAPKTEAFYRDLLNNEKDDFLVLNDDTSVALSSTKLAQTLGYSEFEVKNQNFFSMVHPKDLPELSNVFIENTEDNIGPVRIMTSNGSYIPYVISIKTIENESGEKISTALILKDTSQAVGEANEETPKVEVEKPAERAKSELSEATEEEESEAKPEEYIRRDHDLRVKNYDSKDSKSEASEIRETRNTRKESKSSDKKNDRRKIRETRNTKSKK